VVARNLTTLIKRAQDLSATDRKVWADLRLSNPQTYSPYFHLDYTVLMSELREDVSIICVYENDTPIGFLPYQGTQFTRPVGAPMTDYHGFICNPGTLAPMDIIKNAGIGAFHFSASVNTAMHNFAQSEDDGVMMNIEKGAEVWRKDRDSSYRRHLKSNRRRIRKATEDFGDPHLVWKSNDRDIFDQLIAWKKQKFSETGKYDVLSADWTMQLLETLWSRQDAGLRCDMHALYFGDRLAAVDLGLCDGKTFHSWIVAYDGDLHSYAPGIQLLEGLIDAAQDLAYSRIDLGAGTDGYKRHYASENVKLSGGFIAANGPAATLSNLYNKAENFGQKALKDAPGKLRRRYSQIAACEDSVSGRAKAMLGAVANSRR